VSRFNKFRGISIEKLSAPLFGLQRIHFPANFAPTFPKLQILPALLISSSCFTKIGETRTLIAEVCFNFVGWSKVASSDSCFWELREIKLAGNQDIPFNQKTSSF
jgi:hypothetical protein